eukprot:7752602-Alexandrium_andersonii.AAC.1
MLDSMWNNTVAHLAHLGKSCCPRPSFCSHRTTAAPEARFGVSDALMVQASEVRRAIAPLMK